MAKTFQEILANRQGEILASLEAVKKRAYRLRPFEDLIDRLLEWTGDSYASPFTYDSFVMFTKYLKRDEKMPNEMLLMELFPELRHVETMTEESKQFHLLLPDGFDLYIYVYPGESEFCKLVEADEPPKWVEGTAGHFVKKQKLVCLDENSVFRASEVPTAPDPNVAHQEHFDSVFGLGRREAP